MTYYSLGGENKEKEMPEHPLVPKVLTFDGPYLIIKLEGSGYSSVRLLQTET